VKRLLSIIAVILLLTGTTSVSPADTTWHNPNRSAAMPQDMPAGKVSRIKLENRRVRAVNNNSFTYNTGRKIITVKADSLACRQFIRDVRAGRKSAGVSVTLTPRRSSPFNTEYTAR